MLSTASYEARKYGVRSGMPGWTPVKRNINKLIDVDRLHCEEIVSRTHTG
jgi:nucleotidyltransferase/DNA polymerase involved in DNA repair